MRKWLSSLGYTLAALAAMFLLLPMLMGILAENKCNQMVDLFNNTTPFNLKITDYQRGWFSAKAIAQISLNKSDTPNQLHQLTINANIIHGPLLIDWTRFQFIQAVINANINLNSTQNNLLKRAFDAGPIATTEIKFRLSGDTAFTLESPPLAYQDQESNFYWQGLKINTDLSPLYNQLQSKIEFSGIDIGNKNYNLHLGKMISTYQGSKTSSGLWIGERNLQLDSFATKNDNNRIISLGGLNLHSLITSDQKNSVNVAATLSVDNLNINGATYNQNKLDFEINKLDQSTLAKLQQQLISSKNIFPLQTNIGIDTALSILNNGSEINIKQLNTDTPWGKLLSIIKITFADQPNNNNLLATIISSSINTNISAEKGLALHLLEKFYHIMPSQNQPNNSAKQAEALLNDWQQSGKITTSELDNYLHIIVDYKNGRLSINNKHLTLTTKP